MVVIKGQWFPCKDDDENVWIGIRRTKRKREKKKRKEDNKFSIINYNWNSIVFGKNNNIKKEEEERRRKRKKKKKKN